MADFHDKVTLGRTGLKVSRLGLGSSYSAPTRAYEEAVERGVNYFYWGSRRRALMGDAIRHIAPHKRASLVVVLQSYARLGFLMVRSIEHALRRLKLAHADVLLLGWYNSPPSPRMMAAAQSLKDRGLIGHIAISGHKRKMFPTLIDDTRFDIFHVRYNAVHRGAEQEVFPSFKERSVADRPGLVTYTTTRWGHLCDAERTPPGEKTPCGTDCYRYALSNPQVDLALSGPSCQEHMDQALKALDLGPMDREELAWMERVGAHIYHQDGTSGVRDRV
jgi:aryl-alcohol dehydrogenase-like predicted oxidoreductase